MSRAPGTPGKTQIRGGRLPDMRSGRRFVGSLGFQRVAPASFWFSGSLCFSDIACAGRQDWVSPENPWCSPIEFERFIWFDSLLICKTQPGSISILRNSHLNVPIIGLYA